MLFALPQWTGSNQQLFFSVYEASGRVLYSFDVDGRAIDLIPVETITSPVVNLSQTSDMIAYNYETDVYTSNVEGDNLRQITNSPDSYEYLPAWSHDGRSLAYVSLETVPEVYIFDTESGAIRRVVAFEPDELPVPESWGPLQWSANGTWLLWSMGSQRLLINTNTGRTRWFEMDEFTIECPIWRP